jgi:DNA polymerase III subunit delta'
MTIALPLPWHRPAFAALVSDTRQLHHALLLTGPRGIGKAAFAQALAQALLCENRDAAGNACGLCAACHWFGDGNHPDVRFVQPEAAVEEEADGEAAVSKKKEKKSDWIKILQVRTAQEFLVLSSHRGGRKVLVINPADALQPAAANALLKTLEEPPANAQLILVAHADARLLPTVVSRCRRVPLPTPTLDDAAAWLAEQGIKDARAIAALSGGAPLAAQQWASADFEPARHVLVAELAKGARLDVMATASKLERQGLEATIYLLQTWIADLIQLDWAGSIRYHLPQRMQLDRLLTNLDRDEAFRYVRTLSDARRLASHPLNARLFVEHLLLCYVRCFR